MTRPLSRRLVRLALPVTALVVPACTSLSDVQGNNRYGAVTISATGSYEGPFTATPTATFFRGQPQELPDSRTEVDQCAPFNYAPESFVPGNLEAGNAIELRVGASTVSLRQPPNLPLVYALPAGGGFNYVAGDTVRVTIPGQAGGFPAASIALRLAEPVIVNAVVTGAETEDLAIRWQPNGDARSGIIISLRFSTVAGTLVPNRQLLCAVRDNGAYTIASGFLGEYYSADPVSRSVNVLRWRTNAVTVDERTALYIVSTIDTTFVVANEN
jgi:hypothetical protein